jgi:hypothetical protein
MGLSCACDEWDGEGVAWTFEHDFVQFMGTYKHNRRKRCCSCKRLIDLGSLCVKFERFRMAISNIEYNIHGDSEIPMADWYMCESCGEIFLNLDALKFCIDITEPMPELLKEYHEMTGFKREPKK